MDWEQFWEDCEDERTCSYIDPRPQATVNDTKGRFWQESAFLDAGQEIHQLEQLEEEGMEKLKDRKYLVNELDTCKTWDEFNAVCNGVFPEEGQSRQYNFIDDIKCVFSAGRASLKLKLDLWVSGCIKDLRSFLDASDRKLLSRYVGEVFQDGRFRCVSRDRKEEFKDAVRLQFSKLRS